MSTKLRSHAGFDIYVDHNGKFYADVDGDTLRYDTMAQLTDRLDRIEKDREKASRGGEVAIPLMNKAGETVIAFGVHVTLGNILTRPKTLRDDKLYPVDDRVKFLLAEKRRADARAEAIRRELQKVEIGAEVVSAYGSSKHKPYDEKIAIMKEKIAEATARVAEITIGSA